MAEEAIGGKTQRVRFLVEISKLAQNVSPTVARCYVYRSMELISSTVDTESSKIQMCSKCGTTWQPSDFRIRTQARPVFRKGVQKLLSKELLRPWTLSRRQRKELRFVKRATTKLVYSCRLCGKSQKYPCARAHKASVSANDQKQTRFLKGKSSTLPIVTHKSASKRKIIPGKNSSQVFLKPKYNVKRPQCTNVAPLETPSMRRTKSLFKAVLNDKEVQQKVPGGLQSFLASL
ncbi:uncharacterized protein LOC135377993 [Ornithodoros turicata]|uniref:uncharacterized protein LOC135377993 n=1 Tax=Ornithodoros turicata TaxID=34597 RepID=UPI003138942A